MLFCSDQSGDCRLEGEMDKYELGVVMEGEMPIYSYH
jgi:hypothetical protein